jgi:hypothetical protein
MILALYFRPTGSPCSARVHRRRNHPFDAVHQREAGKRRVSISVKKCSVNCSRTTVASIAATDGGAPESRSPSPAPDDAGVRATRAAAAPTSRTATPLCARTDPPRPRDPTGPNRGTRTQPSRHRPHRSFRHPQVPRAADPSERLLQPEFGGCKSSSAANTGGCRRSTRRRTTAPRPAGALSRSKPLPISACGETLQTQPAFESDVTTGCRRCDRCSSPSRTAGRASCIGSSAGRSDMADRGRGLPG